jgi:hypothetical protein
VYLPTDSLDTVGIVPLYVIEVVCVERVENKIEKRYCPIIHLSYLGN